MELVPGTCAERYLAFKNTQGSNISVEDIEAEKRRLGLDRPFPVRFGTWMKNIVVDRDFGDSCILRVSINELLKDRFYISLAICITALLFSYLIAIPVGIISATTKYASLDNALKFISYLGIALPNFLIALCIMLFMTIYYGDTMTGLFSEEFQRAPWSAARVRDFLSRVWLPIFVLGWNATAFALQTVRALILDENDKLYVMAAKARGISGMSLLWRYPAKHSLGPVINSLGFDLNRIFSALPVVALILILTEAGALLIEALARSNDQQLAGAIIFLLTATIIFVNFVTDVLLAIMDPRIRKGVMGGN
jgi:peptide/nickel transport system permease protein|tara:strand:- start:9455 stop:10381 length:927 start_codon:yes stop_codon:yes gene_type:complete